MNDLRPINRNSGSQGRSRARGRSDESVTSGTAHAGLQGAPKHSVWSGLTCLGTLCPAQMT